MSAQMAHDFRNPLAALKGAVQFLREERSQGRSIDHQTEFLDLLVDQIDRMESAIDKYPAPRPLEPRCAPVQVNELVRGLVTVQSFARDGGAILRAELAPDLPDCALESRSRDARAREPDPERVRVRDRAARSRCARRRETPSTAAACCSPSRTRAPA
jgi:signal transduction histidine kinase